MLEIGNKLRENGYLSNSYINFAVMSAINGVPLLVEGDPGVGKTSLAYATAKMLDLELLRVQFYDGLSYDKILYDYDYQKQLLTIARAMLLDADMLIFDEATSNVDTRTEKQIQQAMRELMEGKTCFVIAHRLSTIQNADEILVVNHGKIVEQGDHQTLMERKGFYYNMYCAQWE